MKFNFILHHMWSFVISCFITPRWTENLSCLDMTESRHFTIHPRGTHLKKDKKDNLISRAFVNTMKWRQLSGNVTLTRRLQLFMQYGEHSILTGPPQTLTFTYLNFTQNSHPAPDNNKQIQPTCTYSQSPEKETQSTVWPTYLSFHFCWPQGSENPNAVSPYLPSGAIY